MKDQISLALAFTIILLISSCSQESITRIPREVTYYGINFTKYSKQNFLVTPIEYPGFYDAIGIVSVELYPEADYKTTEIRTNASGQEVQHKEWVVEQIDAQDAVDSLVSMASRMGADAIINFKLNTEKAEYLRITNPIVLSGVSASGFAIKRKATSINNEIRIEEVPVESDLHE